jgi:hypothetical protein
MNARVARALGLTAVAASLLVAACDDANPPSPLPATRDPNQSITLAPVTYLLRPDQMPGYIRASSATLSAGSLADEAGDPTIKARIESQGLTYGDRYTYTPPTGNEDSTPFRQVIAEALIFTAASGAQAFMADEKVRQDKPPDKGGTVAPLDSIAAANTDEVTGFQATAPASDQTTPPVSFLVLARKGRVVVELLGGGTTDHATRPQFDSLVALEEVFLAQSPDA